MAVADLVVLTKTDLASAEAAGELIAGITPAPMVTADHGAVDVDLLLDRPEAAAPSAPGHHHHGEMYASWSTTGGVADRERLKALLVDPPAGLYRFKGRVALAGGNWAEAHLVGRTHELRAAEPGEQTIAVAIGVAGRFDPAAFEARWAACLAR